MAPKITICLLAFCFMLTTACSANISSHGNKPISKKGEEPVSENSVVLHGGTFIAYTVESPEITQLAQQIQKKIGGDLYPIETEADAEIPDLSGYRLILIGSPAQNHVPSKSVEEFLGQIDFQGRRVSPFWVDSEYSIYYELEFAKKAKNAIILPGLGLFTREERDMETINQEVDGWLTTVNTWDVIPSR